MCGCFFSWHNDNNTLVKSMAEVAEVYKYTPKVCNNQQQQQQRNSFFVFLKSKHSCGRESKLTMSQSTQNTSFQAGEAKGEAQEKSSQMMEKASNAAQSAKDSLQEAGSQMQAKAQGAVDAVKNATGMNK